MNKNTDKTKEQILAELSELRKESKEQEDKLKASNQQLDAQNQQLQATDQQLRVANQQLEANNQQLIASENSLRESEDRLSKTMIVANDGMWDWNLKTNEVYFDPRYYEMAGYKVDEFPHSLEEFQKRIHPDDVDYVMNEAQKHLEGKIYRFIVEFRFKKKNGDWLWIMGRGKIVERDDQSNPIRFIGIHTDITDRKQAENEIKLQSIKLSFLYNLSLSIHKSLSVDDIIKKSLEHIYSIINPSLSFFFTRRNDELKLEQVYPSDKINIFDGVETHRVGECMCGLSVTENINTDLRCTRDECKEAGLKSFAALPLRHEDDVIGVIGISSNEVRDFEKESEFLETISEQISSVLSKAKLHQSLKESETKMRNLFNAMHDIVFEMDYNGTYLNIAPTSPQLMVKPAEETIGKTLYDVFPKQQADLFLQFIQKCVDENKADNIIYPVNFENKTVWFEGRANPIGNKRVLYIASDITERKQAEEKIKAANQQLDAQNQQLQATEQQLRVANQQLEASNKQLINKEKTLKESEYTFKGMFNNAIDAIYVQNEDGIFLDVNQGAVDMYGYAKKELIGNTPEMISAPGKNNLKMVEDLIKKAFQGQPQKFEFWGQRKNGEIFPKIVRVSANKYFGKKVILAFAIDITERKQSEEALRESEKKFRDMTNLLPQVVYEADLKGNLTFVNQQAYDSFGYSPDDFEKGINAMQVLSPEDREKANQNIQNLYNGKKVGI
ncbi:MAG: PAS domain S-box protein, partial [Candidatus Cloacimonadota bacterium]|nr:PAS domain S-box protein [Candidatus Cloacimonadota bacterium]